MKKKNKIKEYLNGLNNPRVERMLTIFAIMIAALVLGGYAFFLAGHIG